MEILGLNMNPEMCYCMIYIQCGTFIYSAIYIS